MRRKLSPTRFSPVAAEGLECRSLLSGLTIIPTFAANIRNDGNSAKIETAIRAAIAQIDSEFSNPISVPVLFQEGGGLGSNLTGFGEVSYATWLAALTIHANDANQRSAIANLPTSNTLNGSDNVEITYANEMALGLPDNFPASFSTVTLNVGDCNLTRTSINPRKYDLQAVAMHELNEALGIGSILDEVTNNGDPIPTDAIDPEDFFRYSAGPNGKRDFTTNAQASVFFSINGGKTDLARFNQVSSGDFNDWYSIDGNVVPQVQDAFATPGVIPNYNVEPIVLDVLGYTPTRALGSGIVTGNVFNDANGNDAQDAGESDLSGWTIAAVRGTAVIERVQSNALGYQLGSLPAGTYTIIIQPVAGYTQIGPSSYSVTITGSNDTVANENFAEMVLPPGAITGTVYNDGTGNGILDGSQSPLAGAKITLHADTNHNGKLDGHDKLIANIKTDSAGNYSLAGLNPGLYFVSETVPPHYVRTAPTVSNVEPVTVISSQTTSNQNFENFRKPASLGVKKISYTIGTTTIKNLRHHTRDGETIAVTFTVTNPLGETLSLASYTAPAANVPAKIADQLQMFDTASNFYAPGTYTLDIDLPSTGHYQLDLEVGDAITQFGPAGSSIFYNLQGRLISWDGE